MHPISSPQIPETYQDIRFMTPRISVILSTYNRSSMFGAMAEAVLRQTIDDFELIIVNDGSNDNTQAVLEEYTKRDPRIVAINKQNGGLSSARNSGIEAARGEFITFVDDDDIIRPDYLESMLEEDMANYDLIIDSYSNQTDNNKPIQIHFPISKLNSHDAALKYVFRELQQVPYCFFAVAKRFKLSIIRKYNIRFSSTIKFVEDRPFVLDYLRHSSNLAVIDSGAYIVKTTREAQCRLSKGIKPADYLCYNILESYLFLCRYAEEMQMNQIRIYAENYLVDKIYTYLMIPTATKRHPQSASKLILKTFKPYLLRISQKDIKNKQYLLFINIFAKISPLLAILLLRYRIEAGKLIRKIAK